MQQYHILTLGIEYLKIVTKSVLTKQEFKEIYDININWGNFIEYIITRMIE